MRHLRQLDRLVDVNTIDSVETRKQPRFVTEQIFPQTPRSYSRPQTRRLDLWNGIVVDADAILIRAQGFTVD